MSTINLVTKFFPLAFILYFFPPRVEVDGGPAQKLRWGQNTLEVAPGTHHLTVYYPYLFIIRKANRADIDVTVAEGQTVTVTYKSRWLVFIPGKIAAA
jgi:hypothetical protein